MTQKMKFILFIVVLVIIVIFIGLMTKAKTVKPGQYDQLAKCLTDGGAKFYGTFWCTHCQNQKKMFGTSASLLPYVECSSSDGKSQLGVCTDAGIEGFPTWVFTDGTTLEGEQSIEVLAGKASCSLPQ